MAISTQDLADRTLSATWSPLDDLSDGEFAHATHWLSEIASSDLNEPLPWSEQTTDFMADGSRRKRLETGYESLVSLLDGFPERGDACMTDAVKLVLDAADGKDVRQAARMLKLRMAVRFARLQEVDE